MNEIMLDVERTNIPRCIYLMTTDTECQYFAAKMKQEMSDTTVITSSLRRVSTSQTPTIFVGKDVKEVPMRLKVNDWQFFLLFDTGKSSQEALERADVVVNYFYHPLSPYSIDYRYNNIKARLLLSYGFYPYRPTAYRSLKVTKENKAIKFSISKYNYELFEIIGSELSLQGFHFFFNDNNVKPRFLITDSNTEAIQSCFDRVPVLHLPSNDGPNWFYSYAVMYGITVPFTTRYLDLYLYDDDAIQRRIENLKDKFGFTEEDKASLVNEVYAEYENHCELRHQL